MARSYRPREPRVHIQVIKVKKCKNRVLWPGEDDIKVLEFYATSKKEGERRLSPKTLQNFNPFLNLKLPKI